MYGNHLDTPQFSKLEERGHTTNLQGPTNPYNTKGRKEGTYDKALGPYQSSGTGIGGTYDKPLGRSLAPHNTSAESNYIYIYIYISRLGSPNPTSTKKGDTRKHPTKERRERNYDKPLDPYQIIGIRSGGAHEKSLGQSIPS